MSNISASQIYPRPPTHIPFPSRRSVVHSTKGIIACSQPLAARAGQTILSLGGNAADAAVAVAAALNVQEPCSTGIGGDAFCLFYSAATKKISALNGSGRSAQDSSLKQVREELKVGEQEWGKLPFWSALSVTVPGAAQAWCDTVERFGSGKVGMKEVLAPAIKLAEEGCVVSEVAAFQWGRSEGLIRGASGNFGEMLKSVPRGEGEAKDGKRAPKAGELMLNPTLGKTFRTLAEEGKKGFYEGRIAEEIVKVLEEQGGHLTMEDLRTHMEMGSGSPDPISVRYGDVELWEHPPNGQGLVALIAVGVLRELQKEGKVPKFEKGMHLGVEHLHAVIECLRIAFADGSYWVADLDKADIPLKEILTEKYFKERAELFDAKKASGALKHGNPGFGKSDTVYFAVTDAEGNGCSFINSNYAGFGTGIIPKGCGFTLQNRGAGFVLPPLGDEEALKHPNAYAPGKRPYHTIIPGMITDARNGDLHSVFGVMGGYMQPQGHLQVLLNMECFGCDPQSALDCPRIVLSPEVPGGNSEKGPRTKEEQSEGGAGKASNFEAEKKSGSYAAGDRTVYIEEGVSEEVIEKLRSMGHEITISRDMDRHRFGRGQVIRCHFEESEGKRRLIWSGGSDPRADGHAVPA